MGPKQSPTVCDTQWYLCSAVPYHSNTCSPSALVRLRLHVYRSFTILLTFHLMIRCPKNGTSRHSIGGRGGGGIKMQQYPFFARVQQTMNESQTSTSVLARRQHNSYGLKQYSRSPPPLRVLTGTPAVPLLCEVSSVPAGKCSDNN
jgi:hypothetical protein